MTTEFTPEADVLDEEIVAWIEDYYYLADTDEELIEDVIEIFEVSEGTARRCLRKYYEGEEDELIFFNPMMPSTDQEYEELETFDDEVLY